MTSFCGCMTAKGGQYSDMLEGLFGSLDAERILLFIAARQKGYGREIATFWSASLSGIQKLLDRLEVGGVLTSHTVGRTRVYEWNPRWPFRGEVQALMDKAILHLPSADRKRLQENRQRPRRRGKPL
jgi:DNA-binding PadR family transcriptional regulator